MTIAEPRARVVRLDRATRAAGGIGAGRDATGALDRAADAAAARVGCVVVDGLGAADGAVVAEDGAVRAAVGRGPTGAEGRPGLLVGLLADERVEAAVGVFDAEEGRLAVVPVWFGDCGVPGVVPGAVLGAVPGAFTSVMPCPLAAAASRRDALACRAAADFFAMLCSPKRGDVR